MQRIVLLIAVLSASMPVHAQIKPLTPPAPPARMGGSVFPPQGNPQTGMVGESNVELLPTYRGFSKDGRLYAFAESSAIGGAATLTFKAVTENDVAPDPLPLDTDVERDAALARLRELDFPVPGQTGVVPSQLASSLQGGRVAVTLRGMPVVKPFKPFAENSDVEPLQTSLVAISRDGQFVAVRTQGQRPDGSPAPPEHDVVNILGRVPTVPAIGPSGEPGVAP
jgi:hypothetical protein